VWNVERGVRDLAHASEPLDIPRILQREWSESEALSGEGGLVWHEEKLKEDYLPGTVGVPALGCGPCSAREHRALLLYISPDR
jgi:hypothetical protein